MPDNAAAPPIVRFYRLFADARPPQRADRSAAGTLPTRATRYCEAVTAASAFGWWVFAPLDLSLLWDGHDIFWHTDGLPDWLPLLPAAQLPGLSARFDQAAPAALKGCCPPFLTALPEPGMLQIWSGLFARSAPGWSLLVRPPANLPLPGGFAAYEGIVECDRWFGPLFINLRLTQTHRRLRLRADFPLLQVQPLPRTAIAEDVLARIAVIPSLDDFANADWADYRASVAEPSRHPERPLGGYAVAARKRRGTCPAAGAKPGAG